MGLDNHSQLSVQTLAEKEQSLILEIKSIQNKIRTIEMQIHQVLQITRQLEEKKRTSIENLAAEISTNEKLMKELQKRSTQCIALTREIADLKEQNVTLLAKMPAVTLTDKIRYSLTDSVKNIAYGQPAPADPNVRVIFASPLTPYETQQKLKKEIADNERLITEKETELVALRENRDYIGKVLLPKWQENQAKNCELQHKIEKIKEQKATEETLLNKELEQQQKILKSCDQLLTQTYFLNALKKIDAKLQLLKEIYDKHQDALNRAKDNAKFLDFTSPHLSQSLNKLSVFYHLQSAIQMQLDSESYKESTKQAEDLLEKLNADNPFREKAVEWLKTHVNRQQVITQELVKLQTHIQRTLQIAAYGLTTTLDTAFDRCDTENAARKFIYQIDNVRQELKDHDPLLLSQERKILNDYYEKASTLLYKQPITTTAAPPTIEPPTIDAALLKRQAICKSYSILLVKYLHHRNKNHRFLDFFFRKSRRARNHYILTLNKALETYQTTDNSKALKDTLKLGQKYKPSFFNRSLNPRAHPEKHLYSIVSSLDRQIKLL